MRDAKVIQTARARRLRVNATNAETRLWNRIRARGLGGFKFVRQKPVGCFVVDFVCREKRLIVEVDGGQHFENARDRLRDRWLTERSYRVLRFWNNDVMRNMEGVLEAIIEALRDETPPHPAAASGDGLPLPANGER